MFRRIAVCGLIASLMGSATAQQATKLPSAAPQLRGEWRRAGPAFACQVVSNKKIETPDPDQLFYACQGMGPISVGIAETALTARLGSPHRRLPQPDKSEAYLYFLGEPQQYPYLIAVIRAGRVAALQTSGSSPVPAYSFNGINLGDAVEQLQARFGAPAHVGPSGLVGTDLWTYGVWPFSFEITKERVTSIRITDPGNK